MPKSIDKNDVDISKLFEWGQKFNLKDRFGNDALDIYVRLIGDAELNRARVFALRSSSELRLKLREKDSDDRVAFIPHPSTMTKENLIDALVLFHSKTLTLDALRDIKVNLPVEPDSDASLEEREEYQKEVDEFPIKREEDIREYVEEKIEEEKKELKKKNEKMLYRQYERFLIDQICEGHMIDKFREACAFYGTFKDEKYKERLFNSMEEFTNIPKELKDQLVEFYLALEIGGEDLKKLQEAMP
jgi:hypothetical protein